MDKLGKRLLLYAVLFALLATLAVYGYLKSLEEKKAQEPQEVSVLVASVDIPAMALVEESMLESVPRMLEGPQEGYINDRSQLVGKYTQEEILAGERFTTAKMVQTADALLSMKFTGNHRAMSIPVTKVAGVSDLVRPGDFVDLVLFAGAVVEPIASARPAMAKLIHQNLQVLAIDKNMDRNTARAETPEEYLVTLAVPLPEVEELVMARSLGDLTMVLRPFTQDFLYDTEGAKAEAVLPVPLPVVQTPVPTVEGEAGAVPPPAPAPVKPPYDRYIHYVIKSGDTLKSISLRFYGDESRQLLLQQVNGVTDDSMIVTGTGIRIPVLPGMSEGSDGIGQD
ncbi:Flp pilus assembly protein CpaB [Anaerotalea alkaliphila]|uniref:Flp pilus assembly protein CpaB n=1 Tax=Anaerotalea alkaliphila TaxID=2662126 RepID=A0A7X5KMU2_9FIRM|nr:Flp pilus assembly protein CpaB [Anaerotalea alkaliphila]NDL67334.1 Flp pilus assembly protein CpaB [Anaerotalea alkaliphila]